MRFFFVEKTKIISLAFVVSLFMLNACQDPMKSVSPDFAFRGETMGTTYSVKYHDPAKRSHKNAIDSLLVTVNQDLSTYIDDSHISVFNKPETKTQKGTPHFDKVFMKAKEIYQKTDGAFDPTVMPLVNYWGFGYTPKKPVTDVDEAKVKELMNSVGFDKIVAPKFGVYAKLKEGTQLDFSAIAKGYGVDVIADFLDGKSIESYMVEIGGEVRAKGKNPRGEWWLMGINTPSEDASIKDLQAKVQLQNKALATSGNYRNFHEVNGKKYAHTINPKTGFPEANTLLSASIFANDCMTADAYATACMVMGVEAAYLLISKTDGVEGYFIFGKKDGTMGVKYTEGAIAYLLGEVQ